MTRGHDPGSTVALVPSHWVSTDASPRHASSGRFVFTQVALLSRFPQRCVPLHPERRVPAQPDDPAHASHGGASTTLSRFVLYTVSGTHGQPSLPRPSPIEAPAMRQTIDVRTSPGSPLLSEDFDISSAPHVVRCDGANDYPLDHRSEPRKWPHRD